MEVSFCLSCHTFRCEAWFLKKNVYFMVSLFNFEKEKHVQTVTCLCQKAGSKVTGSLLLLKPVTSYQQAGWSQPLCRAPNSWPRGGQSCLHPMTSLSAQGPPAIESTGPVHHTGQPSWHKLLPHVGIPRHLWCWHQMAIIGIFCFLILVSEMWLTGCSVSVLFS